MAHLKKVFFQCCQWTLLDQGLYALNIFQRLPRLGCEPDIFWFSFIFSQLQCLRPLGYCALLCQFKGVSVI